MTVCRPTLLPKTKAARTIAKKGSQRPIAKFLATINEKNGRCHSATSAQGEAFHGPSALIATGDDRPSPIHLSVSNNRLPLLAEPFDAEFDHIARLQPDRVRLLAHADT